MDYELYHDESRISGYWHGMLLVPIPKKQALVDYLAKARSNINYPNPLSLKKVRRTGKLYECVESWLTIGVAALMSRTRQKYPQPLYLGNRELTLFREVIGARLVLFRERDNLQAMQYVTEFGSKVEITFRMGLKGALHFLGRDDQYIRIAKLHFDGNEHYHRGLSRNRIIERMKGLRDYCSIENAIDDRSGNHDKPNCQSYEDCQILQLTDLLVSSFRSVLSSRVNPKHKRLIIPVKEVIKRYLQGTARMECSRWRGALSMSQCYLENGQWKFEPINIERENKDFQLHLFDI